MNLQQDINDWWAVYYGRKPLPGHLTRVEVLQRIRELRVQQDKCEHHWVPVPTGMRNDQGEPIQVMQCAHCGRPA